MCSCLFVLWRGLKSFREALPESPALGMSDVGILFTAKGNELKAQINNIFGENYAAVIPLRHCLRECNPLLKS